MSNAELDSEQIKQKIRQQYDFLPYPESDIEYLPQDKLGELFIHSLITPYYLRYQTVVDTKDKIILDAGCGSGFKTLVLALANPGAKIVGVDLSEKSVELASQRFAYHGFQNAEFYPLSLEEIDSLGYKFDYINCDEVLYLLPDPPLMLKVFENNLSENGIIRANLHSHYQRDAYFRSQEAFKLLGLFDEDSIDTALEIIHETLDNLENHVYLLQLFGAHKSKFNKKQQDEWILVNFLLQGDKGYKISELFQFLEDADLDFLSMVNWREWDITNLFKDLENLPIFWQFGLSNASEEEKLQLFELFHPIHRLLDFWATKKNNNSSSKFTSPNNWTNQDWYSCKIQLHPFLQKPIVKEDLCQAIIDREKFMISQYIQLPMPKNLLRIDDIFIDYLSGASLLPLWDNPQSFASLVERWLTLEPCTPDTLETKTREKAEQEIRELLIRLERYTYILLEKT